MESGNKPLQTVEEKITYDPSGKTTTTTTTTVNQRDDGTAHISERSVVRKQGNQINVEESELVGQKNLEGNEENFLKAVIIEAFLNKINVNKFLFRFIEYFKNLKFRK